MFLRLGLGEIALICTVAIIAIALPAFLLYTVAKFNERLREIERKLKDK